MDDSELLGIGFRVVGLDEDDDDDDDEICVVISNRSSIEATKLALISRP